MVIKSDKPDPTAPDPEKPVPNGGIEEPDDQVSTEGGSPVKTEADQRTANDATASGHCGCGNGSLMVTGGGEKQVASMANALRSLTDVQWLNGHMPSYAIGIQPFLT